MNLEPNDGDRISRFTLARYHTGELSPEEAASIEARLDDDARAYLAELDAAKAKVPAFDVNAIRGRAAEATPHQVPDTPSPANNNWRLWLPLLAVALVVLAMLPSVLDRADPVVAPEPHTRVRGEAALLLFTEDGDAFVPWSEGTALGEGDVVGFKVRPAEYERVTVVSIDATGAATVLYPESGAEGEPVAGDGRTVPLPGTFTLDDAPGPELLVAVFDMPVPDALSEAADRYEAGGADALKTWAADEGNVDVLVVERR